MYICNEGGGEVIESMKKLDMNTGKMLDHCHIQKCSALLNAKRYEIRMNVSYTKCLE